jgi:pyridoxamine 5'-phosphate oxidase
MPSSKRQPDPSLVADPWKKFLSWYEDAVKANIKNPDAMTLATSTPNGVPSARIVLYKGVNPEGLRFFTNYRSRKGKELKKNPRAAVVFYWSSLDRQIRIEGKVKELSSTESDGYWNTRPKESRINSLASPQSSPIPDRAFLEKIVDELDAKYAGGNVPRPKHWGGYCLIPNRFEFWVAGDYRLHDRFIYVKKGSSWSCSRLAP